jgi:hypothetical protein
LQLGRVGINFEQFPARKWPNNTVHYMISPLYRKIYHFYFRVLVLSSHLRLKAEVVECLNFQFYFSDPREYQILKTAIDILGFFTCIEFKEWDGEAPDYLIIWPVQKPAGYAHLTIVMYKVIHSQINLFQYECPKFQVLVLW